jgi:hypothetical protein
MTITRHYEKFDMRLEASLTTKEHLSHKLLSESVELERSIKHIIDDALFKILDVLNHERNVRCL